ncbi:hypothetical protein D9M68_634130 [compost metagenome]
MKKLFLAAFIVFAGSVAVQASEVSHVKVISVQDSVVKTPIKLEELPEAIKTALKADPYKDWTPTAAFSVKEGDKSYFQIDLKKEEETTSLKLDAEGKPVN